MAICMGCWNNWRGVEKIDVLLAGPPCRSVSVCRLRSLEGDDGPQIVRARHGSERFGRNGLTEEELKLVCNDNLLWMRTLWLAVQAYEANQNLEITLEHKILNSGSNHLWTLKRRSLVGMAFQASWHGLRLR